VSNKNAAEQNGLPVLTRKSNCSRQKRNVKKKHQFLILVFLSIHLPRIGVKQTLII